MLFHTPDRPGPGAPGRAEGDAPAPDPAPPRERTSSAPPSRSSRPSSRRRTGGASNVLTVVLGKKGMGKTTYARGVYRARIRAGGSGVFIDRTGTNDDLPGQVVTTVGGFRRHLARAVEQGRPFSLLVNLGWGEDHDPLWRTVYEVGSLLLVLDDPRQMMQASRIDPDLEELVELGRNREVDIMATARRPPELHGSLKNGADVAVVFRQGSKHYAEACNAEWFHLPDGAERILSLPRLHYLRAGEDGRISWGSVTPGL